MMKRSKDKFKQKNVDYSIIKPLIYSIIRYLDDGYYNIVDNSVRRNLNWKNEIINRQSTVLDFSRVVLLSRLHFIKCKLMNIEIEIAEKEEGPFYKVTRENVNIIEGNVMVVKLGSLPARYLKITIYKGSPIQDFRRLECYGLSLEQMKELYDEETIKILYYNPYNLVYNINK